MIEEVLPDDWLVTSRISIALVDDVTDVVRIFKYLMQPARGDWLLRISSSPTARQTEVRHRRFQPLDGVLTGGIQFEGLEHQRRSRFIEADTVDHASVDVFSDVEVPNLGLTDRAAINGLVAHLDPDVFPAELVLHLVHDVGDGLHCFRIGAFTEVLTGGKQAHAQLVEMSSRDGRVSEVTKRTGAGIHDDIVNVAVLLQKLQQGLEDGSLLDRLGRHPRLHEFLYDVGVDGYSLLPADVTLRGNGVTVLIDINGSFGLLLARYPKIQNCLTRS
ncbi:hypothetical protein [Arthrobacter sp. Bz4]|uniref:hypothetical protein n=1 Tax=Arthrobacter sp. Bz4 TaxID=2171979 RepID=UPI001FAEDCBB|nr:hypothetical protein [Arthrobacter sp. Bz4]